MEVLVDAARAVQWSRSDGCQVARQAAGGTVWTRPKRQRLPPAATFSWHIRNIISIESESRAHTYRTVPYGANCPLSEVQTTRTLFAGRSSRALSFLT